MFSDLGGREPWSSVACLRLHSENRTWDTKPSEGVGTSGGQGGLGFECMACLRSAEVQALCQCHAALGTL